MPSMVEAILVQFLGTADASSKKQIEFPLAIFNGFKAYFHLSTVRPNADVFLLLSWPCRKADLSSQGLLENNNKWWITTPFCRVKSAIIMLKS